MLFPYIRHMAIKYFCVHWTLPFNDVMLSDGQRKVPDYVLETILT